MKARLIASILFALFAGACYTGEETSDKTTPRRRTAETSTPTPDKSPSPTVEGGSQSKPDFTQARSDYDAKNYEKAAAGFQEVIKSESGNIDAHYYLGKSFQALKKDDDAIAAFKEALKLKSDHAGANFELGNIYYTRKDYETALPFFQTAVKTNFKDPLMIMALGDNYTAMKMHDYAIVQYLKVVEFDKTNADAMYKTGLGYIEMKNKIAARQQVQRLEAVDAARAKKLSELVEKME